MILKYLSYCWNIPLLVVGLGIVLVAAGLFLLSAPPPRRRKKGGGGSLLCCGLCEFGFLPKEHILDERTPKGSRTIWKTRRATPTSFTRARSTKTPQQARHLRRSTRRLTVDVGYFPLMVLDYWTLLLFFNL